jgi:signal transduction histidine kinase
MVEMSGEGQRPSLEPAPAGANGGDAASRAFQRRLLRLRRLSPPVLLFLVEIVAFGLAAGLIGYILPELALRWNEERETSELQALALIGERERMQRAHELSDEAVQSLYAAGALLRVDGGTPKAVAEKTLDLLNRSHQSLTQAMAFLRNPLPRSDVHEASVNSNDVNLPGGYEDVRSKQPLAPAD